MTGAGNVSGNSPGRAAPVDPASIAYRVHAHAFNTLTTMLAADGGFTSLSVREAIASAIVEAIEPLIRADVSDRLTERVAELVSEGNQLREERDKAYRERAHLVAHLSACYPAELTPAESDSGAWWLVFVATPSGQMSWHLHEDDLELFPHLLNKPETGVEWDGHTTEQKYDRLAELTRTVATGIYGPQPGRADT